MASYIRPEDQLWFFLKENMTLPSYVQKQFTLKDIQQRGLSLADCLKITNSPDTDLKKYAFYIHSASMAAAGRLLSDVFIQPKVRHASDSIDVSTMEPITDIAESDKVTIHLGGGRFETFTGGYISTVNISWKWTVLSISKNI